MAKGKEAKNWEQKIRTRCNSTKIISNNKEIIQVRWPLNKVYFQN